MELRVTGQHLWRGDKKNDGGLGGGGYFRVISSVAVSVFVIIYKVLRESVFSGYVRSKKLFVFVWPREIQKTPQKVKSCQGSK